EVDYDRLPFGKTRIEHFLNLHFKSHLVAHHEPPAGRGVDPDFDEDMYQNQLDVQLGAFFENLEYNHFFSVKSDNYTKSEILYFDKRSDRPDIHSHTFSPPSGDNMQLLIHPMLRFRKIFTPSFVNAYTTDEESALASNFKNVGYDYYMWISLYSFPFNTSIYNKVGCISAGYKGKLTFRICAPFFTGAQHHRARIDSKSRFSLPGVHCFISVFGLACSQVIPAT